MKVTEITTKHVLTNSKLPEARYCINPYVGCLHGCVYCYVRFMRRFTKHTEPWGTFVDVKANSGEVIGKDLDRVRERSVVILGSVTDAYQALEKKHRVTRSILQELAQRDFPVSILTKSDLVVRDLDLLQQFTHCSVGFSIMTVNERACRIFEPRAPTTTRRLAAMRKLHEAGVETYAFIGPILPEVTNLRPIFDAVSGIADSVWAERLNSRCGNWEDVVRAVQKVSPDRIEAFVAHSRSDAYWQAVGTQLHELSEQFSIPLVGYFHH